MERGTIQNAFHWGFRWRAAGSGSPHRHWQQQAQLDSPSNERKIQIDSTVRSQRSVTSFVTPGNWVPNGRGMFRCVDYLAPVWAETEAWGTWEKGRSEGSEGVARGPHWRGPPSLPSVCSKQRVEASISTGVQVESQVCKSDIVLSTDTFLSFPQLLHGECEFQVLWLDPWKPLLHYPMRWEERLETVSKKVVTPHFGLKYIYTSSWSVKGESQWKVHYVIQNVHP